MKGRAFTHFFFQAEDGIRDRDVTGVQTCALPIYRKAIVAESLHQAVDPAEAERFANEVIVRQRFHASVGLVKYEPNSATRFVVPCEPRAPLCASSDVEEL